MKSKVLPISILTLLGFLGIFFHIPLFFGVDYIFSSVFTLIILLVYGLRWAVPAAILINAYTLVLWGHPYAWVTFTLEIIATGLIKSRVNRGLLFCDSLYWVFLGLPLSYLMCRYGLKVDTTTTYMIMLKQPCNGIINALIASILVFISSIVIKKPKRFSYTFKESLFSVILTLVCIPLLATMVLDGREYMKRTQASITSEMENLSNNVTQHMTSWFQQHLIAVTQLAESATKDIREGNLAGLQYETEITKQLFPDFHNMYIADSSATTVAFYPPVNEKGESTLGLNFSDRDYFKKLKSTHKPVVSDVFLGRGGIFSPIITLSAPIIDDNEFLGYALAALNLDRVSRIIHQYAKQEPYALTLTDEKGNLIASTLSGVKPLQPYKIKQIHHVRKINDKLYETTQKTQRTAQLKQSEGSYYVFESGILPLLGWNLIVEYPVALQQDTLFRGYIRYFSIVICLILISALLISLMSRELSAPLMKLAETTSAISEITKKQKYTDIALPESPIREIQVLARNFNEMAHVIEANFQALMISEEKYSLAMDATTDGLWDWNLTRKEIYFSPGWKRMLGYDPDELPNELSVLEKLTAPEDAERFWKMHQDLIGRKRDRFEIEIKMEHKDGHWVDILSRANAFFDPEGNAARIVGTHVDISGRKRAEEALRESEHYYRSLFSHANEGLFTMTLDGRLMEVNQAFADMHGYTMDELKQMNIREIDVLKSNAIIDKPEITSRLNAGKVVRFEVEHFHKDGHILNLNVTASMIQIGNEKYYLTFHQDITEKKQVAARLQQAQKMESIGMIAGGIAHDFNNILFPITGMAEMLLEDLPPNSLVHENAQHILKAGIRGSDLVKQILAFSRQTEHKMIPVRPQKVLTEVVKLMRSTIPSNIRIESDLQSDCGLIMADPTQLHQIAMNLITNAYHAVESTDGSIFVRLSDTDISDNKPPGIALSPGRYALLSVGDDGVGIDPGILDKVFDPYFTTKERSKGTGLGLSVVYGIVKEHGGDVTVESELGKGTTFNVYLKMIPKKELHESAEGAELAPTGDERILLVDDEASIVDLQKQMLERLGYKVETRCSSLEALNAFGADPTGYDLVITDMTMPNMTGDHLARKLLQIRKDISIIICTGFSERLSGNTARDLGVKAMLMKPVARSEMAKIVRAVLDEAKDDNRK